MTLGQKVLWGVVGGIALGTLIYNTYYAPQVQQ
jgi:hypothetical protein